MVETYLSDQEFETYFEDLCGMRARIAGDLRIRPGMHILDIATGYGYFAAEVARRHETVTVTGIDIVGGDLTRSAETRNDKGLASRVSLIQMDAARMSFDDATFDMAVNFLGLEDIHMTGGREGVEGVFAEVNRVLKPKRFYYSVVMPVDEMETEAQKIEVALYSYICDATNLRLDEYRDMLRQAGLRPMHHRAFYTGRKLTPAQARREIQFAVENVPRIFGRSTPALEDVWARFGPDIEKHGLGQSSKTVLMINQKV